jgi:hypothetical protein
VKTWRAGALLYSGRPDPTWVVPESRATELLRLWRRLPLGSDWGDPPAQLGYRGCWLDSPDEVRWVVRDGAVAQFGFARKARDSRSAPPAVRAPVEVRQDAARSFERAVLATAPPDIRFPPFIDRSR